MTKPESTSQLPLVVDLDGSLVQTDTLVESFLALIKKNPLYALAAPFWLAGGKANLKRRIAEKVSLDPAGLPYQEKLLELLKEERANGRMLVLATAADGAIAEAVAGHVGLFDQILASDGRVNLSGERKQQTLRERFGARGYVYVGNSRVDLPIWKESAEAIVVNGGDGLAREAAQLGIPVRRIDTDHGTTIRALIRAVRPHQWVKNLLLFLPLILAHQYGDLARLIPTVWKFIAFSLCASSVYVVNDLLDIESDRHHPRKKTRPFASGALPLWFGFILAPLLLAGSALVAALLPLEFELILAGYFLLTLAYSVRLKQVLLLDVVVLAGLYSIRIYAGAAAIDIALSPWLLVFSTFVFLSLAFAKRYSELHRLRHEKKERAKGRGYLSQDLEVLAILGTSSGYISVMVFALYLSSTEMQTLYAHPKFLWFIIPLLTYWVGRFWLLEHRGQISEDPVLWAIKDRISYLTFAVIAVLAYIST